jgi:hypothetical protein
MFRENISTPSSWYISKPSKKPAEAGGMICSFEISIPLRNIRRYNPEVIVTAVRMSNPTNRTSNNFHVLRKYRWNRNSSVGVATRLLAGKTEIRVRFSAGVRKISLPHSLLGTGSSLSGAKRVGA